MFCTRFFKTSTLDSDANARALLALRHIKAKRSVGNEGSRSKKAPPAFSTANTATTVHMDFSKHSGTISSFWTPLLTRRIANRDDK
jgi:hypothetical protein